jgi:hypothetical protein
MADFESLLSRFQGVTVSDKPSAVGLFASVCGCDEAQAAFFLEASSYNLEAAINLFLNAEGGGGGRGGGVGGGGGGGGSRSAAHVDAEGHDSDLQAAIAASMQHLAPVASATSPTAASGGGDSMDDASGASGPLSRAAPQASSGLQPATFSFASSTFQGPAAGLGGGFGQQQQQAIVFGSGGAPAPFAWSSTAAHSSAPPQQLGALQPAAPLFGAGTAPPTFSFSSGPPPFAQPQQQQQQQQQPQPGWGFNFAGTSPSQQPHNQHNSM